jgi:hypothetical protein
MLGFACPWSKLEPFAKELVAARRSPAIQIYAPELLEGSTALWSVELLLELHDVAFDEDRGPIIQGALSRLIEKEAGEIDEGPETREVLDPEYPPELAGTIVTYDREGFRELVHKRKTELIKEIGSENVAVAEGEVLDILTVASKLHRRLTQDLGVTGRLEFERMLFEANTGTDCRSFFSHDYQLQNLQAAAVVEEFLDTTPRLPFKPGRRYFFGHLIPD